MPTLWSIEFRILIFKLSEKRYLITHYIKLYRCWDIYQLHECEKMRIRKTPCINASQLLLINIRYVFATNTIEIIITHTNWQQQINELDLVVKSMQYTVAVDNRWTSLIILLLQWRPTFFLIERKPKMESQIYTPY